MPTYKLERARGRRGVGDGVPVVRATGCYIAIAANPKIEQPLAIANDPAVRSVRVGAVLGSSDAAAEPPWPDFPSHQEVRWDRFMRFFGPLEAHIVAGRLNVEGVPTLVLTALGFEFPDNAEILVPRSLLHRARWVLAWPAAPEDELLYLATGEIGPLGEEGARGQQ